MLHKKALEGIVLHKEALEDRVLHKEAWIAKLLGTHSSIQVHKERSNFQDEKDLSLAVKGLSVQVQFFSITLV